MRMTQEQWERSSEEERNAEYERCKDPVYFYNTYWRKEGDPDLTAEQFEELQDKKFLDRMRLKPRSMYNPPLTPSEAFKKEQ